MVHFIDRMGIEKELSVSNIDETIADVLIREQIPLNSVVITDNYGNICTENLHIHSLNDYYVSLIEGYDIASILDVISYNNVQFQHPNNSIYFKRRSLFTPQGAFQNEIASLEPSSMISYVERTFFDTCNTYKLINPHDKVILGLSGGVDSTSLLMLLAELKKQIDFDLLAVTFQDFDSYKSQTFRTSKEITNNLGITHIIVMADVIQKIFHLNTPLRIILPALMKTEYAHFAMYIDHHTTKMALEFIAEKEGNNKISLGLHSSDILAGLLNSFTSGLVMGDLPKRTIGKFEYLYPLLFITKKELHIYSHLKNGHFTKHAYPNPWEKYPQDRNFFYYLADNLQGLWPGIEYYLFEAHMNRMRDQILKYSYCENCNSAFMTNIDSNPDLCDVCDIFVRSGYINEKYR